MKAILVREYGGPDVLRPEDVPDPAAPGPGDVVVRVHAVGVNPVEAYVRTGTYVLKPALPYTPGSDAAGVIEAVGPDVTAWRVGGRVYTDHTVRGAYAERVVCSATQVHRLPPDVSFAQGAALGIPYATAYRALVQRGGAQPGEIVLVHGATGGVGVATVQIARALGLRVLATGGTDAGRQLVTDQGAHDVFDHRADGYLDQIRERTGGRGVDIIMEMLANVNLGNDLGLLAPHGRVVVVGSRGPVTINPRDTMGRDADIRGMVLFNAGDALPGIHAALIAGLENGTLRPIVAREIPLAEAAHAHEAVMEPGAHGKIVLMP